MPSSLVCGWVSLEPVRGVTLLRATIEPVGTARKAIANHPDMHFDFLANSVGVGSGTYLNMVIGTLCSDREVYLGKAPPPKRDARVQQVFSALIIDFIEHTNADGAVWHGWVLKPEVEAALRHLRLL